MLSKDAKMKGKLGSENGLVDKNTDFPTGSYDPAYVYEVEFRENNWKKVKVVKAVLFDTDQLGEVNGHSDVLQPSSYRYYIHYLDFNRRMDKWVDDPSRIRKSSSAPMRLP